MIKFQYYYPELRHLQKYILYHQMFAQKENEHTFLYIFLHYI